MWRNVVGGLSMLGSLGLIALALYYTKDSGCLWSIILIIFLAVYFPWQKEE